MSEQEPNLRNLRRVDPDVGLGSQARKFSLEKLPRFQASADKPAERTSGRRKTYEGAALLSNREWKLNSGP